MKVGILGTGDVGQSLAKAFKALGHEVMIAGRAASNPKAAAFAKESGAKTGTFTDAARFGDVVAIATLGTAVESALKLAGTDAFAGKLVIDTTNPLDFSKGMPPHLAPIVDGSLGQLAQRMLPKAKVVKCFNTVGNAFFYKPAVEAGPPDMFICGDDAGAKKQMAELLQQCGWNTRDIGGISMSHYLEAMCIVWVAACAPTNDWARAFKLVGPKA